MYTPIFIPIFNGDGDSNEAQSNCKWVKKQINKIIAGTLEGKKPLEIIHQDTNKMSRAKYIWLATMIVFSALCIIIFSISIAFDELFYLELYVVIPILFFILFSYCMFYICKKRIIYLEILNEIFTLDKFACPKCKKEFNWAEKTKKCSNCGNALNYEKIVFEMMVSILDQYKRFR